MYHVELRTWSILGEVNINEDMDFPKPPSAFDIIWKWFNKEKSIMPYETYKALREDAMAMCMEITHCSITLKI